MDRLNKCLNCKYHRPDLVGEHGACYYNDKVKRIDSLVLDCKNKEVE